MRIAQRPDLGHLTYCTNIHKGETWPEVFAALEANVPAIRRTVAGDAPFGLGLRLSAAAAKGLGSPAALEEFKAFLASQNVYVFTINGFPYGQFHGEPVKERVYSPDWSDIARLAYSDALADILAELLPPGVAGTISTVPGTFADWAPGNVDRIVANLVRHVTHLVAVRRRTGKVVRLTLEPEPCCFLETIAETVRFFNEQLYGPAAVSLLASLAQISEDEARQALREHLGLCYDVCHAAIEFEDPEGSIALLRDSGIPIYKLQLSSALRIARVDAKTPDLLAPFNEPTYLHQVVGRRDGQLDKWLDLPQALADIDKAIGSEWRVHFHVPVFLEQMQHFDTTQAFLRDILAIHRRNPISDHLEVETYTWDVLPEEYRGVETSAAIARELNWVKDQLLA